MNPPTVYLFVDLETGGLYYEKHAVYEIAAICTDIYFGEQYFRYTTPIKNSTAYEISDWALDQHNKNGLFQDIEDHGISLRDAEKRLLELLKPQLDNNAKIILAGSNISFDRGFLKRHMPDLESKLHYQMMDETVTFLYFIENSCLHCSVYARS